MVYFHGGGFSFGSAYELPSHEGAQLARYHDVVQVSVNHRLNALGFLDVSEIGGPAYADSANVGMTDLVASLRWIRDNIANFGGDPGTVMIYGQSGGGSKVTCLMGMPSASGLFHRAVVQSGGGGNFPSSEQSRALAQQVMVELGLQPNDIAAMVEAVCCRQRRDRQNQPTWTRPKWPRFDTKPHPTRRLEPNHGWPHRARKGLL
jgi:para-nitrobenzyl esterase